MLHINEILKAVDHTLLTQTASFEDIKTICDDGMRFKVASACIPPSYVKYAKEYVKDDLKICTVISFPNGYQTTEVKVYETADAISNGADEIDMVINICNLKNKEYEKIQHEIEKIKKVCNDRILKVIIEACLLSEEEKIKMCDIVASSGADFIKTSTGFSTHGATFEDVKLLKDNLPKGFNIKAAGGIQSLDDAAKFLEIGATRLGTSRIVKIIKSETSTGY